MALLLSAVPSSAPILDTASPETAHKPLPSHTGAGAPHLDPMHFLMAQTDPDTQSQTGLLNKAEFL